MPDVVLSVHPLVTQIMQKVIDCTKAMCHFGVRVYMLYTCIISFDSTHEQRDDCFTLNLHYTLIFLLSSVSTRASAYVL